MKLNRLNILLISFCLPLIATISNATISVDPPAAATNQTVTATLSGIVPIGASAMSLQINFGDGSPTVSSPTYSSAGTHSFSPTHSYSQPGTYTITGQTIINTTSGPGTPLTETLTILILKDMAKGLPHGIVGEKYRYNLPGSRSNKYRTVKHKLPPGLILQQNGLISGIPTQKGEFTFTVRVLTRFGSSFSQELTLVVDPGVLTLQVTPNVIETTRGGGTSQRITFQVVSPTIKINETIRSTRGEFIAAGRVLGYVHKPMNINLNNPQPSGSEKIRISNNVLRAAQNSGTSKIIYRRTFKAVNLKPGSGETKINMRTVAAGQLRITKLRIFFKQNNRPLIVVERNSRNLTGMIEIHYNGAGSLKGYWKVDERIIQRVQKNIFYGKMLTLKTPHAPPLPTYSEGAHRLQFIITEPESARQKIDLPEAIYHVEAKRAEFVAPITLNTPENRTQFDTSGETFSWTELPRVTTYLIEFFETDRDTPLFTAYTKQGTYLLSEKILSLKFKAGKSYSWHIRGVNRENVLTAESPDRNFEILE